MIIEKIRHIPLLSEMDAAVLDRCIAENQLFVRHYAKGATVHHQHESCSVLDVVLSGKLVAYSLAENGSAIIMFEFQKNSIIGANLLFGENTNYPLNIYGVIDGAVLHISREAVMEFLHDYHFVMRYIKSLSLNSQGMNRKITMLTQKTLRGEFNGLSQATIHYSRFFENRPPFQQKGTGRLLGRSTTVAVQGTEKNEGRGNH